MAEQLLDNSLLAAGRVLHLFDAFGLTTGGIRCDGRLAGNGPAVEQTSRAMFGLEQ